MRNFLLLSLIFLGMLSCKNNAKSVVDVSDVSVNFATKRFEVDFYNSTEKTLSETKKNYPFLFPKGIHDSVWIRKINDNDERALFEETQKVFQSTGKLEQALLSLFKHIKYYLPNFLAPNVITVQTNIDYDHRVIYADSLLLISLDSYLGTTHEFYNDYPKYVKQNNTKEHLIVDVANAIIKKQLKPSLNRVFLYKMIYEGKKMYLLDAYLPAVSDKEKIGYAAEKFQWTLNNEEEIWKYFIENDLLYDTDTKLNQRFLDIAPFSKFYLGEDNKSPGQIGIWVGWQIVRSFMRNNDVSLQQLLQMREEEIFKKSKYKPRR
ncbi:gliding motility lipoprotein GldB [Tenacibaculum maritimum]|uniref:gliding motility lipoprotein GldB n=1 Tax=Tenacibaculum maritimum TaxID=107401 RepID=UPI001E64D16A|nr:gliding motility lipoprotein GldB [Tenacibaculum maritimum]MCD9583688.1 gliding motility lipoprotein GldB [Tenacibaculum maritimum]MCD9610011.1 gliding motility lipoprotein GldB [Tenacibaculum maritimum]MCD9619828.1 gliding motility lipoprotein GldB [Tenacibaculum maritimum]MCD9626060.1 gliding motility lipoprotein GldB [Tenacibaculum maritimum]MCD9628703.1 gliding motility lipoprotein GldB [Tenacibaculum maritimum]